MEIFVGLVGIVGVIVAGVLGLLAYFLPVVIAVMRGHRQTIPIALVCIFLGWTFLGWVIALIWSFTSPTPAVVVQQFSPPQYPHR